MSNKKILYCASTASHLINFHLPYMQGLQEMSYRITACVNESCEFPYVDEVKAVPFHKQITSTENIKNIFRVRKFLKQEKYTAISVHTTLAAAVVRAAVLLLPKAQRPKVFYTCHGYLFGDDDGLSKWKYLLPEKLCANVTDVLMVMNAEDKALAEKHKLYNKKTGNMISIPGMGVDFSRFDIPQTKAALRAQYGVAEDEVLYVFAGEFSKRKNQQMLINAFARVAKAMPKAKLILAGQGALLDDCKQLVYSLQLEKQIYFPGHVQNMPVLYRMSDVCVSASQIEGLPFNIMEAMYCKLPCVVSDIKGHSDLIAHGKSGYLCTNEIQIAEYMMQCYQSVSLRQRLGAQGNEEVQQYKLEVEKHVIMRVYEEYMQ